MTRRYLVICESGPTNMSGFEDQPLPQPSTRMAEVAEGVFAEWLTVSLPIGEAISA